MGDDNLGQMSDFAREMLDRIANALSLSYEQLGQDYARAEYSSFIASARSLAERDARASAAIQARLTVIYFSPHGRRIRDLLSSRVGRRRRRGERLMQQELHRPVGYFWKGHGVKPLIYNEPDDFAPGKGYADG